MHEPGLMPCPSSSPAFRLEALIEDARAAVAAGLSDGALRLPHLDQACRTLFDQALPCLPGLDFTPSASGGTLHLLTEIYPAGGHRVLVEHWMRHLPDQRHHALFTGLGQDRMRFSQQHMARLGAEVVLPPRDAIAFDLWLHLRARIAALQPRHILLAHHPDDVLARLIAAELAPIWGRNLMFLRHADTLASLGADLAGITHLAIRPEQAARLRRDLPGTHVALLPLATASDALLPRLVAEPSPATPLRHRLSQLAFHARHLRARAMRRWLAMRPAQLGHHLITATCGTEHKFTREGPLALARVIVGVLQAGARRHVHVGPLSRSHRQQLRDALKTAGIAAHRLRLTGEVASLGDCLRWHRVTLCLGSFPVAGGLSRIEAAAAGIPLAILDSGGGAELRRYLQGSTLAPPGAMRWRDLSDLLRQIAAGLSRADLVAQQAAGRSWQASQHGPGQMQAHLARLLGQLPPPGPTRHSGGLRDVITDPPPASVQIAAATERLLTRPAISSRRHFSPPAERRSHPELRVHCLQPARIGQWSPDVTPQHLHRAVEGRTFKHSTLIDFLHGSLPRIAMACAQAPPGTPVLITPSLGLAERQLLRRVLPWAPLHEVTPSDCLQIDQLWRASGFNEPIGSGHPACHRWLHGLAAPPRHPPWRRLMLWPDITGPLGPATRRLLRQLEARGFTRLDPHGTSFTRLRALLAETEVMIAPDTADLGLMVLLPQGARVMALGTRTPIRLQQLLQRHLPHMARRLPQPDFSRWSGLASDLDLKLTHVVGRSLRPWRTSRKPGLCPEQVELLLAHFPQAETPGSAPALLDALDAMADEADRLTGAWGMRAEPTPLAFTRRAARLRAEAARALASLPLPEVLSLLAHPLFTRPARALRIGPTASDPAALARLHAALAQPPGPDLPRQLALNMLGGPGWRAPLPPPDLDEALLGPWLNWAAAPALLHDTGEDTAWTDHAARLLDWIADALPGAKGTRRALLIRTAMQLDLGPLLLGDLDHRPAHAARARVLAEIAPTMPAAPGRPRTAPPPTSPPRIGLICRSLQRGPDAEALLGHVEALPRGRFHIEAFSLEFRDRVARPDAAFMARLDAVLAARHTLPPDPVAIRAMIAAADLDLLLLTSATSWGITPLDLALFHPLARVGAVLNSHVPLPLGYPGLAGFITGPSPPAWQTRAQPWIEMPGPILPPPGVALRPTLRLGRAAFGLPSDGLILLSGAPAQKLRQPCLAAMISALQALPDAQLVLAPHNPGWAARSLGFAFNAQVSAEAARAGVDPARIHIMGELTRDEAEALLAETDIYLNPFPHGGATMTRLALGLGVPPVTMARRSTRSIDPFILADMGLEELVLPSAEAWVARIVRLGRSPELRTELHRRILAARPRTSPQQHARHFEAALMQAVNAASRPPPPADAPPACDGTAPCPEGT